MSIGAAGLGVGRRVNSGKLARLAPGVPVIKGVRSFERGLGAVNGPFVEAAIAVFFAQVLMMVSRPAPSLAEWWTATARRRPPWMKLACAAKTGLGGTGMTPTGERCSVESLERGKCCAFSSS
jgi:hypothetical protein